MKSLISIFILSAGVGCLTAPRGTLSHKDLIYAINDGKPLHLDLYQPKTTSSSTPVLVWIHGGSWKKGSKKRCPLIVMADTYSVISVNYRLSSTAPFPAPLEDLKALLQWIDANSGKYHFKKSSVALLGPSSGGHLASLLALTGDSRRQVRAVVALYPVSDLERLIIDPYWRRSPDSDVGRFLGGALEQNLEKAAAASPLRHVKPDSPPFFIVHGVDDKLVPVEQSDLFVARLKNEKVEVHYARLPGEHGMIPPDKVRMAILNFLQRHLYRP